jgi:RNA polymerase sigma factor (sigma-70 family)
MSQPNFRHIQSGARGDSDRQIVEDLALVARLAAGGNEAWHTFVEQYSLLLYGVVRRKLFAEDEDEIRTVYVDILHTLYHGKIAEYRGQSPLSAWLVVLARGVAVDFLRKRDGRDQLPAGYETLSEVEREVFRLRYVEGLKLGVVVHVLRERGHTVARDDLTDMFERIERGIGPRYLRSLEYRLQAARSGVDSGRLLRYLVTTQTAGSERGRTPLDELIEKEEGEHLRDEARSLLSRLTRVERLVLRLRYQRGWPAERVARVMRLAGAARVYQITRRATNKLTRDAAPGGERT